jgi:predicted AAA+ superfamily ATPase
MVEGSFHNLFEAGFKTGRHERLGPELGQRIVSGGYPAASKRASQRRRASWYQNRIEALVQRDGLDLARISSLDGLPRLLALAAGQTARLLNISDMASPFHLSRPTIRDYVTLLESLFLVEELQPWYTNRLKRLVKTPKLYLGDTGLASALLGSDGPALNQDRAVLGQPLETFVFNELKRQASWQPDPVRSHHFRDRDGYEVDLVLERSGGAIAGVEVKAAAAATPRDFRGLRKLGDAANVNFCAGVVLYDGETSIGFGDRFFAVPIRSLWETPCLSSSTRCSMQANLPWISSTLALLKAFQLFSGSVTKKTEGFERGSSFSA